MLASKPHCQEAEQVDLCESRLHSEALPQIFVSAAVNHRHQFIIVSLAKASGWLLPFQLPFSGFCY